MSGYRVYLRGLILLLILTLVFEGIVRKVAPGPVSTLLLFAKDGLILLMIPLTLQAGLSALGSRLLLLYGLFILGMVPLVLLHLGYDPVMVLFGVKQYLLYPWVAFAFIAAFRSAPVAKLVRPFRVMTVLAFFLGVFALVQQELGPGHWVNQSVTGEDLSGFSAAGRLRVSGTFSFVAQFSWYLLAVTFAAPIAFFWRRSHGFQAWAIWGAWAVWYLVAMYTTISRTAIAGSLVIFVVAGLLTALKGRATHWIPYVALCLGVVLAYQMVQFFFPEVTEPLDVRMRGQGFVESDEVQSRSEHFLTGWRYIHPDYPPNAFGYGLGSMSNGVQQISSYAARIREEVWGETDTANTVIEGGIYLMVIWYGFRLATIMLCFFGFLALRGHRFGTCGALALGHAVFVGIMGTLGVQPPWAIWFWLSVGVVLTLPTIEAAAALPLPEEEAGSDEEAAGEAA